MPLLKAKFPVVAGSTLGCAESAAFGFCSVKPKDFRGSLDVLTRTPAPETIPVRIDEGRDAVGLETIPLISTRSSRLPKGVNAIQYLEPLRCLGLCYASRRQKSRSAIRRRISRYAPAVGGRRWDSGTRRVLVQRLALTPRKPISIGLAEFPTR